MQTMILCGGKGTRLREETENHPRAGMQTAPEQGQFLHLLALILGAEKTLEIGVFMGYSSTWVALAPRSLSNGPMTLCAPS